MGTFEFFFHLSTWYFVVYKWAVNAWALNGQILAI